MSAKLAEVGLVESVGGNITSMRCALARIGVDARPITKPADVPQCRRVILPGVGAFGLLMERLQSTGLDEAILRHISDGRLFLGVCVGMQVLAEWGEEHGASRGLGVIPGRVRKLRTREGERLPHMGWNDAAPTRKGQLFESQEPSTMYYVHSYAVELTDERNVAATCDFAGSFVAAVERDHVMGVQFHPEKSQGHGLTILRRFCASAA